MATSLLNVECKRYGCMKNLLACYANCRFNTRCEDLRSDVLLHQAQATADINAYRAARGLRPVEIQPLKRGLKFVELSISRKEIKGGDGQKVNKPRGMPMASPRQAIKAPAEATRKDAIKKEGAKKEAAKKSVEPMAPPPASRPQPKARAGKVKARVATRAAEPPPPKRPKKTGKGRKPLPKTRVESVMSRRPKEKSLENRVMNESLSTPSVEAPSAGKGAPARSAPRRRAPRKPSAAHKNAKKVFIILNGDRASVVDEHGLISQLLAGNTNGARFFEAKEVEARLEITYKR